MIGAFVWMACVGSALGGMMWGAYYFYVQDIPREVRVPNYLGKGQKTAQGILAKQGLKLRVAREVYDPRRPSGTILSGEPPPGKAVRIGREIAATISRGPEPIRMYDFSELTLQQARAVVVRDGLRLGLVMEQYHDRIPSGYVCGQYPEAGEPFPRTEPINLIVSRGPQPAYNADAQAGLPTVAPPTPEAAAPTAPLAPPDSESPEALVQRVVQVRVAIPKDTSAQEVRIVARDADGERTVYRRTHQPGEVVQENVQVTRAQGATGLIRIYVGGSLFRELRV
jgi:serine/threonine-protein kinase